MYSEISPIATTLPETNPIDVDPALIEVINSIGAEVLYGADVRMAEEPEPEPEQPPAPAPLPVRKPNEGVNPGTAPKPGDGTPLPPPTTPPPRRRIGQ